MDYRRLPGKLKKTKQNNLFRKVLEESWNADEWGKEKDHMRAEKTRHKALYVGLGKIFFGLVFICEVRQILAKQ